jgi:hypothetical protein
VPDSDGGKIQSGQEDCTRNRNNEGAPEPKRNLIKKQHNHGLIQNVQYKPTKQILSENQQVKEKDKKS